MNAGKQNDCFFSIWHLCMGGINNFAGDVSYIDILMKIHRLLMMRIWMQTNKLFVSSQFVPQISKARSFRSLFQLNQPVVRPPKSSRVSARIFGRFFFDLAMHPRSIVSVVARKWRCIVKTLWLQALRGLAAALRDLLGFILQDIYILDRGEVTRKNGSIEKIHYKVRCRISKLKFYCIIDIRIDFLFY